MSIRLSASLVLFNSEQSLYEGAIKSILAYEEVSLYIVDNSPTPLKSELFLDNRISYFHSSKNVGFGAGHNLALKQIGLSSEVHLFLNPDLLFSPDVLPKLLDFFQNDLNIGAAMPKVLYFSGADQRLCKLLPTPLDLIFRRFFPFKKFQLWINRRYELWDLKGHNVFECPNLSGCFLLCRTSVLQFLGGFDERYFMYLEDVDLVRRIGDSFKTLYIPSLEITHKYEKGSYRSGILLFHHVRSAVKYFNKWGWFYDPVRRKRNNSVLHKLKSFSTTVAP